MDNTKNNEVYICFDVEDPSVSSFISYLIAAFNRQGISAFFDGKSSHVEAGDRESEEGRFSKVKVFVVVFSENYVSHVPCLEKHIYSCMNNDDFVVVPVFYHVSIEHVKQYVEHSGHAYKAVQIWMPKLRRCHEYDGERSESEFQEEIARDVFEKLHPTEEIGIQSLILEIEILLRKQPWGVRTIGIFGVRGIGKTTLAKATVRRMSGGYDDYCFFKDFQKRYNEKKLKYLPTKYLSDVALEKFDINCSDSEPRRRKKRILIVLDDVQNFENAKSFLGGFDNFSPGSLIIITSRDKKVLQQCQMNKIYELKGLNDEDARKLFARCAFGKDVIEESLLNSSMEAIKCCDGNPSDLRSYAKRFKAQTIGIMDHHVSCGEDDEHQENREPPSGHNDVLATTDTIILTGPIKRDTRDGMFYRMDNYSFKSLFQNIRGKRRVLHQILATQLQKLPQRLSNTRDLDQLDLLLNLSTGVMEVVPKERTLNRKGINGMKLISSGKSKHDPDQGNGLGLSY